MVANTFSREQGNPGLKRAPSPPAPRPSASTYYEYHDANELLRSGSPGQQWTYYEYDHRGNCTEIRIPEGTEYFSYNDADLVTSIRYKSGICNYFHYDANLRRYALEDSAGLTYLTWDQNAMNLLGERDSTGEVTAEYAHGQTPINGIGSMTAAAKESGGSTYYEYPVYDHRGSVFAILDQSGQISDSYLYNAWGERLDATESGPANRFGYQSNWIVLPDSGGTIYISRTRSYHAPAARFLSRDKMADIPQYQYGFRGQVSISQ